MTKNRINALGSGLAIMVCLLGNSSSSMAADAAGRSHQVTVRLDDLGDKPLQQTVTAKVGDTLEVRLETRAVGYVWKLTKADPEAFEQLEMKVLKSEGPKPGASEFIEYRFRVKTAAQLEFEWRRPFGKSQAQQFWLKVKVD